jgi:tRNA(fMet)-specific endonuclease VapC
MAEEIQRLIFLDSSVLIEYFRKTKKQKSFFYQLQLQQGYSGFLISGVIQIEIFQGSNYKQKFFWENLFQDLILVPFGIKATQSTLEIISELRLKRRGLPIADLIIAGTALSLNLPLATLNKKHFTDIDGLQLLTPDSFE